MNWVRKIFHVFILGGLLYFICLSTPAYCAPFPEVTTLVGKGEQLTIATYNVENLDPKKENVKQVEDKSPRNVDDDLGSGHFSGLAETIVNNLKTPDILALQEVQDNDGAELTSVVDATQTADALIGAIQTAGGPTYEYKDIAPVKGEDGGQPGGNIRTGFLFNPKRVQLNKPNLLTDRTAFINSRKPLVGEFDFNNNHITVINNHFASKRGGAASDIQRVQQAEVVSQFVNTKLSSDSNADIVVLGDLNDTPGSEAVKTLEASGLQNLVMDIPSADRFSFIFKGDKEQIDHILVSSHLQSAGNAEVDVVHVNLGAPKGVSDHDPVIARFQFASSGAPVALSPGSGMRVGLPVAGTALRSPGKILPGQAGDALIKQLASDFAPKTSLGYGRARDILYTKIDNKDGVVTDIYAGYQVKIKQDDPTPRRTADILLINTEHVWPQSKGAKESAKSDLHNLFSSLKEVNSDRANYPFADIADSQTTSWYLDSDEVFIKPTKNIDAFSEFKSGMFEPREVKKGNIARVMFYFQTIYPDLADADFFKAQRTTLCKWQAADPIDEDELARSQKIAKTDQGNENPFVLDASLAERTYCASS